MQQAFSGCAVCSSVKPKDIHYERTRQEWGKMQIKKCDQMEYPNAASYALFVFLFCNDTQHFALFQFEKCYCVCIKSLEFFVEIRNFVLLFILPKIRFLLKEKHCFRDFLSSSFHQFKCTLKIYSQDFSPINQQALVR